MKTYGDMQVGTIFHSIFQGSESTYRVAWKDRDNTYCLRFGQTGAVPFPNREFVMPDVTVLLLPGKQSPEAAWRMVSAMPHGPRVTNAVKGFIPSLANLLNEMSAQVN